MEFENDKKGLHSLSNFLQGGENSDIVGNPGEDKRHNEGVKILGQFFYISGYESAKVFGKILLWIFTIVLWHPIFLFYLILCFVFGAIDYIKSDKIDN